MAERRQDGAHKRTDTARRRTGLAFLISGFAAPRLLNETGPTRLPTAVGVLLVRLSGVAVAVVLVLVAAGS